MANHGWAGRFVRILANGNAEVSAQFQFPEVRAPFGNNLECTISGGSEFKGCAIHAIKKHSTGRDQVPQMRSAPAAHGFDAGKRIETAKVFGAQFGRHGRGSPCQQVLVGQPVDGGQDRMGLTLPEEDPAHIQNDFPIAVEKGQITSPASVEACAGLGPERAGPALFRATTAQDGVFRIRQSGTPFGFGSVDFENEFIA